VLPAQVGEVKKVENASDGRGGTTAELERARQPLTTGGHEETTNAGLGLQGRSARKGANGRRFAIARAMASLEHHRRELWGSACDGPVDRLPGFRRISSCVFGLQSLVMLQLS
jgi:hypothetical protein